VTSVEAERLSLLTQLVVAKLQAQIRECGIADTLSAWVMVILVPPQLVELGR
jgi:hypothetical protein